MRCCGLKEFDIFDEFGNKKFSVRESIIDGSGEINWGGIFGLMFKLFSIYVLYLILKLLWKLTKLIFRSLWWLIRLPFTMIFYKETPEF